MRSWFSVITPSFPAPSPIVGQLGQSKSPMILEEGEEVVAFLSAELLESMLC